MDKNYAETYYRVRYPYLYSQFEYNYWYYDYDNILYIHPNGIPMYINIGQFCKHNSSSFMTSANDFVELIRRTVNNTYNVELSNPNDFKTWATVSFTSVKESLIDLYRAKSEIDKNDIPMFLRNTPLRSPLKNMTEVKSVNTPLSNAYGYFNDFDKNMTLHTATYPTDNYSKTILVPKDIIDFHKFMRYLFDKPWFDRHHGILMYQAFLYINKDTEISFYF